MKRFIQNKNVLFAIRVYSRWRTSGFTAQVRRVAMRTCLFRKTMIENDMLEWEIDLKITHINERERETKQKSHEQEQTTKQIHEVPVQGRIPLGLPFWAPYSQSPSTRRDAEELAVAPYHHALQRRRVLAAAVDQLRRAFYSQGWTPPGQRACSGKPQARSAPANQRATTGIMGPTNRRSG